MFDKRKKCKKRRGVHTFKYKGMYSEALFTEGKIAFACVGTLNNGNSLPIHKIPKNTEFKKKSLK